MSDESDCRALAKELHDLIKRALDADAAGDKGIAIDLYMKGADIYLKIKDLTLKEKLKKFAIDAIERAESLKGIKTPTKTIENQFAHSSTQSKNKFTVFLFHFL